MISVNGHLRRVHTLSFFNGVDEVILQQGISMLEKYLFNACIYYIRYKHEDGNLIEAVSLRGDDCSGPFVEFRNGLFWTMSTDWVDDDQE